MKKAIKIHVKEISRLASLQCTKTEAAGALEISLKTFNDLLSKDKRAKKAWDGGQQQGRVSLRRKQHRLANVSAPMAIFLGKNILSQKDTFGQEVTGKDGGPVQTMDLGGLNAKERQELRALLLKGQKSEGDTKAA